MEKLHDIHTTERPCSIEEFTDRYDEISTIYQQAFKGEPWNEQLEDDEVHSRIDKHMGMSGFRSHLSFDQSGRVTGALWYDTPTVAQLEAERGAELAAFARAFLDEHDDTQLVWEREIIVDPESQRQGIASRLRAGFLEEVQSEFLHGTLVLTRMRCNNDAIMKIARRFGYLQTGITEPCTLDANYYHEFWFRYIEPC